jgi:hypothetical protein
MIQGTTPTHKFHLPFDTENIKNVRIAYEQKGKIVLTKELTDCDRDGECLMTTLTQEETLKFDANVNVRIQLHVRNEDDKAIASKPISVPVYVLLDKRVI